MAVFTEEDGKGTRAGTSCISWNHSITEGFGLGGTLKTSYSNLPAMGGSLSWAGTPSTRKSCSNPTGPELEHFQGWDLSIPLSDFSSLSLLRQQPRALQASASQGKAWSVQRGCPSPELLLVCTTPAMQVVCICEIHFLLILPRNVL